MAMSRLIVCVLLWGITDACTPPFASVEDACYFYSGDQGILVTSWDAANTICQSQGGYLAVVKHGEENRAIVDNILVQNVEADAVLLGGRRNEEGLFEWLDGSLVRDTFTAWSEGQPSGNGGCMGYSADFGLMWDDFKCESYTDLGIFIGFLCEEQLTSTTEGPTTTTLPDTTTSAVIGSTTTAVPDTTTSVAIECTEPFVDLGVGCYYLEFTEMYYGEALDNCASLGSHLAYITSEEEQNAIGLYLDESGLTGADFVWFGGCDAYENNTFYWLDGSAVDDGYTNYYLLNHGDENGLILLPDYDWQWGDWPYVYAPEASFCEKNS